MIAIQAQGKAWQWCVVLGLSATLLGGCFDSEEDSTLSTLTVISKPIDGANVNVGDEYVGNTPVEIPNLPDGAVVITLEADGYKPYWEIVQLPEDAKKPLEVLLAPRVGYISLTSQPEGARVIVDGEKRLGKTPLERAPVAIGSHTYELHLENYEVLTSEVMVEEDFRYSYAHIMKPLEGELEIYSVPTGGRIWLNGELQPQRTPTRITIRPGAYTVAVHAKGFVQAERTVELQANGSETLEFELIEGNAPPGMVLVPEGEYVRGVDGGSPDEAPQSSVFVAGFYIDKYEVSNAEYQKTFPAHQYPDGKAKHPVLGVTFSQARAYAQRVGKRLPTEAEWEKAARGTEGLEFPWGEDYDEEKCNVKREGKPDSKPVGTYPLGASVYGCLDMAGNAYEWTSSWYTAYPGNEVIEKEYGQVFRVLRGGSYLSDPFDARCARRVYDQEERKRPDYGFRCALDEGATIPEVPEP
jgi:iron(II)-dependent oxidoreductase